MQDLKLGQIITGSQSRDAIHIAVAPVVAGESLAPGSHVGFMADGRVASLQEKPIGIVDPFLLQNVLEGERVWLFLYPNTITSLRHEWAHPAFDAAPVLSAAEVSRKWIEAFAADLDQTYSRLMQAAEDFAECGDWTYDNSERYKRDGNWERFPEFWRHYEVVTGAKVADHDEVPFTCSC